jgi:general secretion pathway protein H
VSGFSLIEITVAVVVLASLTGLAMAHLAPTTDRMRLRAEAREIAAIVAAQRTRAVVGQVPMAMTIDADRNTITYGSPALVRQLPATLAIAPARTTEGGGQARGRIVFFPEGGSSGGAFVLSSRSHSIVITVDWLTGRIALERVAPRDG